MFAEMEREGFYPPRFDDIGGVSFQVTLRNQPVYDHATLEWLQRFKDLDLSGDQKRLLAYAHAYGDRFTSRDYQKLTGLDIYRASNSIKDLIRKGAVRSTEKGSRIYKIEELTARQPIVPDELRRLLPILQQKGFIQNKDVCRTLGAKPKTATRLLDRLVMEGWLERAGERRGTRYVLGQHPL
jgi:DNA-binding MarR family transcriptional regulator